MRTGAPFRTLIHPLFVNGAALVALYVSLPRCGKCKRGECILIVASNCECRQVPALGHFVECRTENISVSNCLRAIGRAEMHSKDGK